MGAGNQTLLYDKAVGAEQPPTAEFSKRPKKKADEASCGLVVFTGFYMQEQVLGGCRVFRFPHPSPQTTHSYALEMEPQVRKAVWRTREPGSQVPEALGSE